MSELSGEQLSERVREPERKSFGGFVLGIFSFSKLRQWNQPYETKHIHLDQQMRDSLTDAGAQMLDDFYEDMSGQYECHIDK